MRDKNEILMNWEDHTREIPDDMCHDVMLYHINRNLKLLTETVLDIRDLLTTDNQQENGNSNG